MKNNQEWFNRGYPKKTEQKIKLTNEEFQGQLVVEDYQRLEKLYLRDIKSIDKVILKNLPQLQECTIWNCKTQGLLIENCPQLKKLNVRRNLLVSLEFLKELENLEKLEIDGNTEIASGLEFLPKNLEEFSCENTKLTKILGPFQSDWKAYRIVELAKKRPRELLETISNLREQNKKLKKEVEEHNNFPQPVTLNNPVNFEKKYQELKENLNSLLKENKAEASKTRSLIITAEILKKIGELKKSKTELEEQLASLEQLYPEIKKIPEKERELEQLRSVCLSKAGNYGEENMKKKLDSLLELQTKVISFNDESAVEPRETTKELLVLKTDINSEELDKLCELQSVIAQLQKSLNQRERKISQVINNYNITVPQGNAIVNSNIEGNVDSRYITCLPVTSSSSREKNESLSQRTQIEQKEQPVPKSLNWPWQK